MKNRYRAILTAAALAVAVLAGLAPTSAFAQAGGPNITAPIVNDSTRTTTDAAKKSVEAERKRLEDEAKKKAADGK